MGDHTAKRALGRRLNGSQRGHSLASIDASNCKDGNVQYCNRLGCSTRLYIMESSQVATLDRANSSKPSLRSTCSKSVIGNFPKKYSSVQGVKKPNQEHKKAVSSETSNTQVETKVSKGISSTPRIQAGIAEPKDVKPRALRRLSVVESDEVKGYKETSNSKDRKKIHERSELGDHDKVGDHEMKSYKETANSKDRKKIHERSKLGDDDKVGLPSRSYVSRNVSLVAKPVTHGQGANASKCSLRNLRCTSISDVLPAGFSSSHSSRSRKIEVTKRSLDGDSYIRGKISRSSSRESSGINKYFLPHRNLDLEYPTSQQASRRTGVRSLSKDAIASVRTPTVNGGNRARMSGRGKGNNRSLVNTPAVPPPSPQNDLSVSGSSASSSSSLSQAELPAIRRISFEGVGSGNVVRNQLTAHMEDGSAHSLHDPSSRRDGFRRFDMGGFDEVLFALEMIEQDEELAREHLYFRESFLGGLNFFDQHRDMRLDIDNMSYEELLALEEKIGTVSTALTEDALADCVQKSYYMPELLLAGSCGEDIRCSICQEEYSKGDEVGKLGCDHGYHLACIHHWLRLKNWCPVCKTPAAAHS